MFGPIGGAPGIVLAIVVIWSMIWKGIALWRSARNTHKWWFIALFVLSTAGILPIIYLAFFQKRGRKK